MKIKDKINSDLLLGLGVAALGLAHTLLSGKKQARDQEKMKDELKKDILKSLAKDGKES